MRLSTQKVVGRLEAQATSGHVRLSARWSARPTRGLGDRARGRGQNERPRAQQNLTGADVDPVIYAATPAGGLVRGEVELLARAAAFGFVVGGSIAS